MDGRPSDTIDEAYRRYFSLLWDKCQRILLDSQEAQDAAQEAFIRLWQSGMVGQDERQVTAWIYRAATRLSIDRLRARRIRTSAAAQMLATSVEGAELADVLETRQALEHLSRHLTRQELEILCLYRFDRLTQPELAEVLGVSERTVRRQLRRSEEHLERLRKELAS